jgi:hypothetical protein
MLVCPKRERRKALHNGTTLGGVGCSGAETVFALHAFNASTEMSCLSNIQEHVNPSSLPVLPQLLSLHPAPSPVLLVLPLMKRLPLDML